jgi:hypothetical protein
MADVIKMQLAITTLKTLSESKTPFSKFQVFKQVWELVHKMHPKIIGSEESWSCFAYILMQASYPHLNSDAFIVTTSLDMFLEGEGYLLTMISTFCTASHLVNVVNMELEAQTLIESVTVAAPSGAYVLPPHLTKIRDSPPVMKSIFVEGTKDTEELVAESSGTPAQIPSLASTVDQGIPPPTLP